MVMFLTRTAYKMTIPQDVSWSQCINYRFNTDVMMTPVKHRKRQKIRLLYFCM